MEMENPVLRRLCRRGCEFLGCDVPVICGAMTWVSDPALVSAVTNAGGFAALAGGSMPAAPLLEAIAETRSLVGGRNFAVNLIVNGIAYQEQLDAVVSAGVPMVVFAAGIPRDVDIQRVKDSGARVMGFASTEGMARRQISSGVDALIIEGMESGGHVGPVATSVLIQQVLFNCDAVPVFVAGGIATGRMMAHLLMMGAAGIQMGTRFVTALESTVHQNYKDAILRGNARDARTTCQFSPEVPVAPVRALVNEAAAEFELLQLEMIKQVHAGEIPVEEAREKLESFWLGGLRRAARIGDVRTGSLMAGQSAGMVTREQSVKDILQELMDECGEELIKCRNILNP
jgi:enoyl-[acyl-carrier protein] reductase II